MCMRAQSLHSSWRKCHATTLALPSSSLTVCLCRVSFLNKKERRCGPENKTDIEFALFLTYFMESWLILPRGICHIPRVWTAGAFWVVYGIVKIERQHYIVSYSIADAFCCTVYACMEGSVWNIWIVRVYSKYNQGGDWYSVTVMCTS